MSDILRPQASVQMFNFLRDVVATACNTSVVRQSNLPGPSWPVKRLDLSGTKLTSLHIAAICSALRYGCRLESVCLRQFTKELGNAERKKCWQWLAFGIFYPRSKKLAADSGAQTMQLGDDPFSEGDIEAFIWTMVDPAGQLVYQGRSKREPAAQGTLLLCTVMQGADFYSTTKKATTYPPV